MKLIYLVESTTFMLVGKNCVDRLELVDCYIQELGLFALITYLCPFLSQYS